MRVTKPSTCGCTVVDRRDFTVPTNSVACSTGCCCRVTHLDGHGRAGPPERRAGLPHAHAATASVNSDARPTRLRLWTGAGLQGT